MSKNNDKIGHASVDFTGIDYNRIAQKCNLGERYTIIGISLYGTNDISVSLLCRDNEDSTIENEVLVNVYPSIDLEVSNVLERLNVTINITNNTLYDDCNLDTVREVNIEENEVDEHK
jgi:hypothetical protein